MIVAGAALAILAGLWVAAAFVLSFSRRLTMHQALLLVPLKIVFALREGPLRACVPDGGALFVVVHRSRLDAAMMLTMLPDDTLHILDSETAHAWWMEPFRAAGRTIEFNASQVFVSRRLVRTLKGGGRIAVYLPDMVEPDPKTFRLYRAVARIAQRAQARIVPLRIGWQGEWPGISTPASGWPSPPLEVAALAPTTIEELRALHGQPRQRPSLALLDRLALLRIAPLREPSSLFGAVAAALRLRPGAVVHEDQQGTLDASELLTRIRQLARRLAPATDEGETIGIVTASPLRCMTALLAVSSAGRSALLIDPAPGPEATAEAAAAAALRIVLLAGDDETNKVADAIARAGIRVVRIEEGDSAGPLRRLWYRLTRQLPAGHAARSAYAAFHRPGDAGPIVLPDRLLLGSAARIAARIAVPPVVRSTLAPMSPLGVSAGLLLPLLSGSRIVTGTTALDAPELVMAKGAPPASADRHRTILWQRNGEAAAEDSADSLRGWSIDEIGGPVALESSLNSRPGTVGRILPGLRVRLDPVAGIADRGRLFLASSGSPSDGADERKWFDTGLLCSIDSDGYIVPGGPAEPAATIGDVRAA